MPESVENLVTSATVFSKRADPSTKIEIPSTTGQENKEKIAAETEFLTPNETDNAKQSTQRHLQTPPK